MLTDRLTDRMGITTTPIRVLKQFIINNFWAYNVNEKYE